MTLAWKRVRLALEARGFTASGEGRSDCFVGDIVSGSVKIRIEVTIDDYDFLSLPRIRLLNRDELPKPVRGHLSEGDFLCYADQATLLLDRYQPERSVLLTIERARATLAQLLHGNPDPAILNEFFAYWGGAPYAFIDPPLELSEAVLGEVSFRKGYVLKIAASHEDRLKEWAAAANAPVEVGVVIPVVQCRGAVKPSPYAVATLEDALAWARSQDVEVNDIASLVVSKSSDKPGLFLAGSNGIFGFLGVPDAVVKSSAKRGFRESSRPSLWLSQASKLKVERVRGVSADQHELVSRNLAGQVPLLGKRIALVGCGTLGSYLARSLVQCGAGTNGNLLLVDPDLFGPGNIGRHLLGVRFMGRNKAEALAEALRQDFPDVEVEPIPRPAQNSRSRFLGYDIIIDATGSEQFSESLNAWALARSAEGDKTPAILYAYLDGNGVAAQTFFSEGHPGDACFRCLRPVFDRPRRYHSVRTEFENPEIAVRPCGDGTFVPFSVDATMIAASLALRHVIDAVTGTGKPTLRTRVIDKLKGRHQNDRTLERAVNCPACGNQAVSQPNG